eukprot:TRINITY_DN5154_c0_g2_i1.p1 TRINITY_DN5154_c0_g2~~TRINITY_DN5154_c0_g2_i1.p1  ORF type:complete len:835 (-),score=119.33 TRINITY_DN5154_c0_g2_i1:273-2777(-)
MRLFQCAPAFMLLLCAAAVVSSSTEIIIGNTRVQALSPTLIRVEPKGPLGFEDRTTFTVVDRGFRGAELTKHNDTWLSTPDVNIYLASPGGTCVTQESSDVSDARRSPTYPAGTTARSAAACCEICDADNACNAWVFATSGANAMNCWPLNSYGVVSQARHRTFGRSKTSANMKVTSADNSKVLYDSSVSTPAAANLLHFPSPLVETGYAVEDYPRFFVPEWGPAPIPANATIDPALKETNGYDFRNNVAGDTYVFLLGDSLQSWQDARQELIQLTGPCPALPDFAFGTWFTWWHNYSETEAKTDIVNWENRSLPIDVWALDMNWRNITDNQDHFYDHPDTALFPDFGEWFEYLKSHKLRTYFNDHPFPVAGRNAGGLQTSPEEIAFRWQGLTEWLLKGLTYWWFDHNWSFSIPPPFVNTTVTDGEWDGLDNAAWGSHIYFKTVEYFDKTVRDPSGDTWYGGRPMTLTKFGKPDWRSGMPPELHAESPAHHRFPVWWTGDGVDLQASVEAMVDSGVHDLKPYVHSDCGGDYRPKEGGDLLRWTAHCVFGTILRFHGNDHRPWSYDQHIEAVIKTYLEARYRAIPSLIAAGHQAALTGHPLVARCDLFWPELANSSTNQQYLWLNSTLVAPVFNSTNNQTSREVWIPPGDWQDAWDGAVVTGPKLITVSQPYERIPMWTSRSSSVLVTIDNPELRVDDQDWSQLTLQLHPASSSSTPVTGTRTLVERAFPSMSTRLSFTSNVDSARLVIEPDDAAPVRRWAIRVHLLPGHRVSAMTMDGESLTVRHVMAQEHASSIFSPFGVVGTPPAAGSVAEVLIPAGAKRREIVMMMENYAR